MFDATDSDSETPRCEHQWWIREVIVGDTNVTLEEVCAVCGALAVASY
jgi:hypothetical protein